jgi:hypothetical protein
MKAGVTASISIAGTALSARMFTSLFLARSIEFPESSFAGYRILNAKFSILVY